MKSLIVSAIQVIFTFSLYILGICIISMALFPGLVFCYYIWLKTITCAVLLRVFLLCIGIASAYFIYGLCLIVIVGVLRIVLRLNLREGEYPMVSLGTIKWAFINSLCLLVSTTFMDFILLTPIAPFFYRLMGAKVGMNVQINSKYCADLSLLEIGDGAVIGGHATVICHSFERNRLILKKVKIGRKVIIGLNSVILPGTEIGDGALIAAGSVLKKNEKVEPLSVYFGVPAESVKERRSRLQGDIGHNNKIDGQKGEANA